MTREIREAMCGRGILASLSISVWTGNKLDREMSEHQQTEAKATAKGAIRVHKSLISDPRLKVPAQIAQEARRKHAELTLPWHYDGVGLLPNDKVLDYDLAIGSLAAKFWTAVNDIEASYGDMIKNAILELGDAFKVEDYPHATALRGAYAWQYRFERIPTTAVDDLRLELPEEVVEVIKGQISNDTSSLLTAAAKKMVDVLAPVIARLRAKEEDGKARLHKSTFDALLALPAAMRSFNITDSPEMGLIIDAVERSMIDVDDAKNDPAARAEALDKLSEIQGYLKQYFPE